MKQESTDRRSTSDGKSLEGRHGGIEVRSVAALAKKYGFAAPDEWVGPESSRAVLDYDEPPEVLADSSQEPNPKLQEELWEGIFRRASELSDHADST
ncbi:MAG: hypothetical protein ACLP4R_11550 [Solirubrobacteraceae bacterium]